MHSRTKPLHFKSWIEISRSKLMHNLREIRHIVGPKVKIACVVKANAYGHGLSDVVSLLEGSADWFCVDNIDEALKVRSLTKKPILILGYTPISRLKESIENEISMVVYNKETIREILKLNVGKRAKIHIKVETGLNRQGVRKLEVVSLTKLILKKSSKLTFEGISTHFANIEDTLDPGFAKLQLKNLKTVVNALRASGINPPLIHCAASAGTILYPNTHFNMVRIGISLYGLWPSRETKIAYTIKKKKLVLKPVLSWKSIVAQVKNINAGDSVGYGRSWFAPRKTKIAVVPVGYSDGYDRKLSNRGRVLINGKYASVIGRVAMNMIVVDVSNIKKVEIEDIVTLVGKSANVSISLEELAERSATINYEVVARLSSLLPRFKVK